MIKSLDADPWQRMALAMQAAMNGSGEAVVPDGFRREATGNPSRGTRVVLTVRIPHGALTGAVVPHPSDAKGSVVHALDGKVETFPVPVGPESILAFHVDGAGVLDLTYLVLDPGFDPQPAFVWVGA